ncbi:rhomboid family intramembrane serine protease [Thermoactinospora rubra]|uniref:rhomboid family intramembrane serine protease n=1 Tax=Thermoactinospora rubra TaxID=1088767 RepID=UPI000A10A373|nr:rhomboid family intramembrane serine protease [Thermoactinospora rubra]
MTSQPAQPSETVPTCYRHADRETWVRCQRCDRPICPDCMRDAAVGFQCPECVAEGNKTVRQAQTVFGGRPVATPYVTWTILGAVLVAFAAQYLTGDVVTAELAMNVAAVAGLDQYYRMITSAFLHFGIMHILFNGWAIWAIGPSLERAFGHVRFAALYLLSAFGGSVMSYWFDAPNVWSAGASGAVYGLFAAIFIVGRRLRFDVRGVVVIIALNLAITFLPWLIPGVFGFRLSWTAHVGGLITGAVVSAALAYAPRANRTLVQTVALVGVAVLLVGLTVVRTAQLAG